MVGYLLFTAAGEVLLSHRLNQDEQRLEQELTKLRRQQVQLEAIREYLKTDEYIEGVARRVLGLVRPGETLVIVSSTVPPTPMPDGFAQEDGHRWWEALYEP